MPRNNILHSLLLLLTGIALALTAIPTHAQQTKPNILVIWGDDIGQFNVGAYNMGVMGYKTPNIDTIARGGGLHRLVRPAIVHGRPRGVHHGSVADSHRPHQGRPARCARGHEEGRPDHRHAAEGARVHDGAVRQEPPWRSR